MKDSEKGMGSFIFRKKHAGRSTQFEFDAGENVGVLKFKGGGLHSHILLISTNDLRTAYM